MKYYTIMPRMKNSTGLTQEERAAVVEVLLTVDELAERLRLKKSWIYGHIHAGTLPFPFLKVGHYVRFPAAGVQRYLDSQLRTSA